MWKNPFWRSFFTFMQLLQFWYFRRIIYLGYSNSKYIFNTVRKRSTNCPLSRSTFYFFCLDDIIKDNTLWIVATFNGQKHRWRFLIIWDAFHFRPIFKKIHKITVNRFFIKKPGVILCNFLKDWTRLDNNCKIKNTLWDLTTFKSNNNTLSERNLTQCEKAKLETMSIQKTFQARK